MFRLHKQRAAKSGDKIDFRISHLKALQVPMSSLFSLLLFRVLSLVSFYHDQCDYCSVYLCFAFA